MCMNDGNDGRKVGRYITLHKATAHGLMLGYTCVDFLSLHVVSVTTYSADVLFGA
jgi:hypothetical protein